MYYLVKTVTNESIAGYDIETELVMKSMSKKKLQSEIKRLFDEAVEGMDEDGLVNNLSKEDFDDGNGYFDENKLLIYTLFPTLGMDRETIDYAIASDENTEEI